MAFLAPLFLLALATLAVPVIIHMIQRERKEVVEFPSLMFLRKVPYHSFRRQRIRNWLLLALRCAAIGLLIAAFARPFLRSPALAAVTSGAREVVVLLDRSYSMGYGDRWSRAQAAATDVVDGLTNEDRATVIFFDNSAEAGPRSTTDRASLVGLIAGAEPGSGTTRFGPALKLAEGIFEDSDLPQLEAVLVSDYQRSGVESAQDVRFPTGTILTPVPISDDVVDNVSVAGVTFDREIFSGRERLRVSARVTNRSSAPIAGLDVTLELGVREAEVVQADLDPNGSTTVRFAPVTMGSTAVNGTVRIEGDQLPTDDAFYFVASPGQVVNVLVVGNERSAAVGALYVNRALSIGSSPAFDVTTISIASFDAGDLNEHQVVVLNDTRPPTGQTLAALEQFVADGGGLLVAAGERSVWPAGSTSLMPGVLGAPVDRSVRGGSIVYVDYSHPVFELFSGPRSGDVTSARFFRHRAFEPVESATVLASFDDGSPALVEQRIGEGRVIVWCSTLDNFWNDLALKSVYLPFVHRLTQHLGAYATPSPWFSAGQVLNLAEQRGLLADAGLTAADLVAVSPSGARLSVSEGERAGFLTLAEQGFYEIRDATTSEGALLTLAANVDLSESDLSAIDPAELASSVTGRTMGGRDEAVEPARTLTGEDLERRQSVWWYLLVLALGLLIAETVVSNRLSRTSLQVD